jgi:hypothetical protein
MDSDAFLFYMLLERYVVAGIVEGAVKEYSIGFQRRRQNSCIGWSVRNAAPNTWAVAAHINAPNAVLA